MGSLTLPAAGLIYCDAQIFVYSVEKHPDYGPLLLPLWQALQSGTLEAISSELTLMEALVGPLKNNDAVLSTTYEQFFQQPGIRLLPITQAVLREAAQLRATTNLRTPDALHAASAMLTGCILFLTNDYSFRCLTGFPVVVLEDLLAP